jgi:hypothetical protein
MFTRMIRALAAGALFLPTAAFAEGPFGVFPVGDWSVGAYTDNPTRKFSHCAGAGVYKSGIVFLVSVDANYNWFLGFIHESWRLRNGDTFPINLTFNNRRQFRVYGEVLDRNALKVAMPGDSELIRHFRWAREMTAHVKGNFYTFNLANTSRLLPALVNCVEANQGKFDTALRTLPNTPTSYANSGVVGAASPELHLEAVALATNFMLGAQLQNPRVLSHAETPASLSSLGAAWKSDEASGFVMIVEPSRGMKGLEVAAVVANAESENCKGKFATGRVSDLVDSEVVFRGFSSCEDTNGFITRQFFVVPRRQGGFVVFSVAEQGLAAIDNGSESDGLEGYQRAALTAVEK